MIGIITELTQFHAMAKIDNKLTELVSVCEAALPINRASFKGRKVSLEQTLQRLGYTGIEAHKTFLAALGNLEAKSLHQRIVQVILHKDYAFCSDEEKQILAEKAETSEDSMLELSERTERHTERKDKKQTSTQQSTSQTFFRELSREQCGGKGMFLSKMHQAGLRVPPFKSINLSVLQQFKRTPLDTAWVKSFISDLKTDQATISVEEISDQIGDLNAFYEQKKRNEWLEGLSKLISSDGFYHQVKDLPAAETINDLYCELIKACPGQAVIARSSGIHEDNYEDAQAGKFDSHVQGKEPILQTCLKVMASGCLPTSCPKGNPQPLSIVLQTCIDCRFGGVILSHSSLQDDSIQVEYTSGQPKGAVAGDTGIRPHHYSLQRDSKTGTDQWIPGNITSLYQLKPSPDGSGYYEEEINNNLTDEENQLPKTVLAELKTLVRKLEGMLLCPVDVEFAVAKDNTVYLLQVRPITRLTGGCNFSGGTPDNPQVPGQLVSEGCCCGVPVHVDRQLSPDSIPKGAIIYADHASNWMLEADFLKRAGGFVLKQGGVNDHVAITLRQVGKPCLIAGDNFHTPTSSNPVTLVAGNFTNGKVAFVVEGDQSTSWLSRQMSVVPDYDTAIALSKAFLSKSPGFECPEDGFAWLSQQNDTLLNYFHADRLFNQCLSSEQSKLFSMSATRSDIARQLLEEVQRFSEDMAAFLQGYERFLQLAGETKDQAIQQWQHELALLRDRLETLNAQIKQTALKITNALQPEHSGHLSDYPQWLEACQRLKHSLQSLTQPGTASNVTSLHDMIYFIHKRFVEALAPIAESSGLGNTVLFEHEDISGTWIDFLKPSEAGLLDQKSREALKSFDSGRVTILDLPTAFRLNAPLGSHVCEIGMFEKAGGGKGRKLKMSLSDAFTHDKHYIQGKFKRFYHLVSALKAMSFDDQRLQVSLNESSGKLTIEYSPIRTREEMQSGFAKMVSITGSLSDLDFTLDTLNIDHKANQWDFSYLAKKLEEKVFDKKAFAHSFFEHALMAEPPYVSWLDKEYQLINKLAAAYRYGLKGFAQEQLQAWFNTFLSISDKETAITIFNALLSARPDNILAGSIDSYLSSLIDKNQAAVPLKYLREGLRDDKTWVLNAVRKKGDDLKYVSDRLRNDQDIALAAIKKKEHAFLYISNELKNDRSFVLEAARKNGLVLQHVNDNFKKDAEIVMAAIKQNGWAIYFADSELQKNINIGLAAVSSEGNTITQLKGDLNKNYDIGTAAVRQNGGTLKHLDASLQDNKALVLEAVNQSGDSVQFASNRLKNDLDVALSSVRNSPFALEFLSDDVKKNKDIVLEAVRRSGYALQYAHDTLLTDLDFMEKACKASSVSLKYAPEPLRNDKAFIRQLLSKDSTALQYLSQELRDDPELISYSKAQNPLTR